MAYQFILLSWPEKCTLLNNRKLHIVKMQNSSLSKYPDNIINTYVYT